MPRYRARVHLSNLELESRLSIDQLELERLPSYDKTWASIIVEACANKAPHKSRRTCALSFPLEAQADELERTLFREENCPLFHVSLLLSFAQRRPIVSCSTLRVTDADTGTLTRQLALPGKLNIPGRFYLSTPRINAQELEAFLSSSWPTFNDSAWRASTAIPTGMSLALEAQNQDHRIEARFLMSWLAIETVANRMCVSRAITEMANDYAWLSSLTPVEIETLVLKSFKAQRRSPDTTLSFTDCDYRSLGQQVKVLRSIQKRQIECAMEHLVTEASRGLRVKVPALLGPVKVSKVRDRDMEKLEEVRNVFVHGAFDYGRTRLMPLFQQQVGRRKKEDSGLRNVPDFNVALLIAAEQADAVFTKLCLTAIERTDLSPFTERLL